MALDFETSRMLWCIDVINGKKEAREPTEIAECFIRATNLLRLYSILKDRMPETSRHALEYASAQLKNPIRQIEKGRAALLDAMLKWESNTIKSLPDTIKRDITELPIFDFGPDDRAKVLRLINRVIEEGQLKSFKLGILSSIPMVWLHSDENNILISAEPFIIESETLSEFDSNEADIGQFFSRVFMLALYAKKNNLFSKEEINQDAFASRNSKEMAKLFLKCAKESDFSIKISNLFKEGDFWGAVILLNENENIYKTMKHAGMCTLIHFVDNGTAELVTFSTECALRFDTRSLEYVVKLREKDENTSVCFITAVYSMFYALQQFFTGFYDVTKEFEPETKSKLIPVQIFADCIFGHNYYEGNLTEFIGFKNMLIKFKGGGVLDIKKAEEDFEIGDPITHSVYLIMATMQGATVRTDFYFMPVVWHLLVELKTFGAVDPIVVARTNNRFATLFKTDIWKYDESENKIKGYFTDTIELSKITSVTG
ncbi:MAG: hypothetical protein QW171_03935 [Candidatus Bilamarchaeaceae archaeon]